MQAMIELIEGIISAKKTPKESVSFSYDLGSVNYIPLDEEYKFNFLMLKNQALDSGTFKINDVVIFPNEQTENTLFFMTVNSLVRLHLCFLCETKAKKDKVKEVQDALIALRDLPKESFEDQQAKTSAIIDTIKGLKPAYVITNLNDEGNKANTFFVKKLEELALETIVLALEEKPEPLFEETPLEENEVEFEHTSITIGSSFFHNATKKEVEENPILFKNKKEDSFGKVFAQVFKDNYMAFLSFIAPSLGVIAFCLLSPLYAQTNKVLLIPFIITIIICFVLFIIMTYRCAIFKNKNELWSYLLINLLTVMVAYGLSVAIYFIFLTFDTEIKAFANKGVVGFVVASIAAVILVTSCLYVRPIGTWFVNKFKKKKK